MFLVTEYVPLEKGRVKVHFDHGTELVLYRSEVRQMKLEAGSVLSEADYRRLLEEIVAKRAKKRALHLLERSERTERELREKLAAAYPTECVDAAIEYVSRYHYLDDYRYACNYVRCRKDQYSRMQLQRKLSAKGVDRDQIERALMEEYEEDESVKISAILQKRRFAPEGDRREFIRNYQYLVRRGFSSGMVLRIMQDFGASLE